MCCGRDQRGTLPRARFDVDQTGDNRRRKSSKNKESHARWRGNDCMFDCTNFCKGMTTDDDDEGEDDDSNDKDAFRGRRGRDQKLEVATSSIVSLSAPSSCSCQPLLCHYIRHKGYTGHPKGVAISHKPGQEQKNLQCVHSPLEVIRRVTSTAKTGIGSAGRSGSGRTHVDKGRPCARETT